MTSHTLLLPLMSEQFMWEPLRSLPAGQGKKRGSDASPDSVLRAPLLAK